jgi:hypothetical protein
MTRGRIEHESRTAGKPKAKAPKIHKVSRHGFIRFLDGGLMERDGRGVVHVYDLQEHWEAEAALDAGEPVYLTQGGKIVTVLQVAGDEVVERRYDDRID